MTNEKKNPFTPTFGSIPLQIAGREAIISDIMSGLDNEVGDPNRVTILVGPRGSGKTVLLAKIAEDALANGWLCVNVNADTDMLDEILIQIRDNSQEFLTPESLSHITSINIGAFGFSRNVENNTRKSTWRSEMTGILKELNEKGTGLLITVDEITPNINELKTLIVSFQHFIRERRDAALIMAGLPQKVSGILRDDAISFLRRAFQHNLGPIEENEVRYSIKKTVEIAGRRIDKDALDLAVKNAKGYPFLIQLIGYHMWRQHPDRDRITKPDADEGVHLAQNDLKKMVFDTTYRELSDKDIAFLNAMLSDKECSSIADVAKRMGVTAKYAGIYRKRLIEQGIIGSIGHGKVAFELPMFREYMENHSADY